MEGGRGRRRGILLLDVAGTFDQGADEHFCIAVYCGYYGRGDGLGEGLVGDLDGGRGQAFFGVFGKRIRGGKEGGRGFVTFLTVSFLSLMRRNML